MGHYTVFKLPKAPTESYYDNRRIADNEESFIHKVMMLIYPQYTHDRLNFVTTELGYILDNIYHNEKAKVLNFVNEQYKQDNEVCLSGWEYCGDFADKIEEETRILNVIIDPLYLLLVSDLSPNLDETIDEDRLNDITCYIRKVMEDYIESCHTKCMYEWCEENKQYIVSDTNENS